MWFAWFLLIWFIVGASLNFAWDGKTVKLGGLGIIFDILLALGIAVFLL